MAADSAARDAPALAIICPPGNARYTLDPELPARRQMLELTANTADPAQVNWTMNGQAREPRSDGRVFCPLARGTWTVVASLPGAEPVSWQINVE